jgi:hypothetical protein
VRAPELRPALLAALALSCATSAPPPSTIEPTAAGGPGPAAPPGKEDAFVLSRRPAGTPRPEPVDIHLDERWWHFRSDYLRMSEAQIRARDADISEVQAPDRFWDEQTAVEAINVWTAVCNECHGGRRRLEDALKMPTPARAWGRGEGLFFGARRRYADVFIVVYRGGPERKGVRSEMPAWRGKVAKELIWALLYFLEYQSGGIEGRFPPSLYPRRGGTAE